MAIRPKGAIRRQLGTLFNLGAIGELTDGQLLERFATRGGEAAELAFAALVERHGPMVLRVCRNTLRDPNDVQDAFQATFLVLVQKSRSLWVRDSLGPWLHRVAYRVATRAKSSAARRQRHERHAAVTRQTVVSERGDWDERVALLHEEIDRLPDRFRVPIVICDLQGFTHERAARHLGWPAGTVKSRLARARELLRDRLSRKHLGIAPGLLMAGKPLAGAFRASEFVLPSSLVECTVQAAAPFTAGKALAVGVISSPVAILIEEVLKTMFLIKLKLASVVVLLIGAAGAAGVLAQSRGGSAGSQAADSAQERASSGAQPARRDGSAPSPAPAYITQSRAMIITRLEEEVAEAQARLDRTLRKVRSPADPAVVHARKTFEDLQQRLDRIDGVLVDVVETYPTLFDFSGGPADLGSRSKPTASPNGQTEKFKEPFSSPDHADPASAMKPGNPFASPDYAGPAREMKSGEPLASPEDADHARAIDRAVWATRMFVKGYVSKAQLDAALADSKRINSQSEAKQPQNDAQHGRQKSGGSGLMKGQGNQSPDKQNSSLGQQGNSQRDQSQDRRNPSQGQKGNTQQSRYPDQGNPDAGQTRQGKQNGSQDGADRNK